VTRFTEANGDRQMISGLAKVARKATQTIHIGVPASNIPMPHNSEVVHDSYAASIPLECLTSSRFVLHGVPSRRLWERGRQDKITHQPSRHTR
jgi:hypothetical protein